MQDPLEEDSCGGLLLFDRVDVVNDATAIIRNDTLHPPNLWYFDQNGCDINQYFHQVFTRSE